MYGALEGYNGTIFVYGSEMTGKTHTLCGSDNESGIIKLALSDIF